MSDVAALLRGLGAPRVVVVGDLMLDSYLFGSVSRISPEAPIPVLRVTSEDEQPGGAASVGMNLRALGAEAALVGYVADDGAGGSLRRLLEAAGVDHSAAVEVEGRSTTLKTRMVARTAHHNQQMMRLDREDVGAYSEADSVRLCEAFDRVLEGAHCVVISDYAKGVVTEAVARHVTSRARERGVPVVVDPKGRDYSKYAGATLVTPNRKETLEATGIEPVDAGSLTAAGLRLIELAGVECAVVTLDKDGMALVSSDGTTVHVRAEAHDVYDVTGAGDVVAAAMGIALGDGLALADAVRLANAAAGVAVTKLGAVPVTREEIFDAVGKRRIGRESAIDVESLQRELAQHRADGRTVVFTNGCFDVLHAGHVRFLRAARAEGDVLVVGLNSDASVRRLKGGSRPVNVQADRAETLGALRSVAYVAVFEEDTPLELIRALGPDVLVKGEDWRAKGVVGREEVEARGGRVVLVPLLEGRSTTRTLERMADAGADPDDPDDGAEEAI